MALLGKLVEDLVHEPDNVLVKVLSHKYLHAESVLVGQCKQSDSYIWRGIMRAKNNVMQGYQAFLGDGRSSFWYDNWLGTGKLCSRVPFVHITDTPLTMSDLWRNGTWHLRGLYTVLPSDIIT